MSHIFTLHVSCENGKLLTHLVEIASCFAFKSSFNIKADILVGYKESSPFYPKIQVITPSERGEDVQRLRDILLYLSKINPIAPYSAEPMLYFGYRKIKEAWKPGYLGWIHENLKKMKLLFPSDISKDKDELRKKGMYVHVCKEDERLCALVLTALSTGLHRHAIAIKQIASQEVITKVILENKRNLHPLITALAIDSYIWMPKVLKRVPISKTSELHYSIATIPIRDIEDKIEEIEFKKALKDLSSSLNASLTRILNCFTLRERKISEFKEILQKIVKNGISQSVEKIFQLKLGKEVLLGRFLKFVEIIEKKIKDQEETEKVLLMSTEQTGPAFIEILRVFLGAKEVTLLYTPQTLYNRLLMQYLHPNCRIDFLPITSTEPANTQIILRELLAGKNFDLVILQGAMSVVLPTLLVVQEKTSKRKIVIY